MTRPYGGDGVMRHFWEAERDDGMLRHVNDRSDCVQCGLLQIHDGGRRNDLN